MSFILDWGCLWLADEVEFEQQSWGISQGFCDRQ
jgi:hypothetical protein